MTMMRVLLTVAAALCAATLCAAPVLAAPACDGNTLEINACLSGQLDTAKADLARYVAAAKARLQQEAKDDAGVAKSLVDFDKAETLWTTWAASQCDAVYDYWSSGTIRDAEALNCQIGLTRDHTHLVWRTWLTYMDSTPPILPEPPANPN